VRVKRLTASGVEEFQRFLDMTAAQATTAEALGILLGAGTSEELPHRVDVDEDRKFATRFEFAEYLDLALAGSQLVGVERDVRLWAWLALLYFEQLCPARRGEPRRPGERARWIPAVGDYRKYYRHLVAGPWLVYRAHRQDPDRVKAVLAGPLDKPGDVAEQLASRQELVTNGAVMSLATLLYIDSETGKVKRGAAGRGPGSARRLADVLNQLDLTWDLYALDTKALLAMMPSEFERFA
jgi:hypothetical protein